jgi:mono/diheme cytochrome c family protein
VETWAIERAEISSNRKELTSAKVRRILAHCLESFMKQFLLGSLCTLCVAIVGGLVYMWLGLAEVRGDTPASRLESSLMQMAVHASVRRQAPNVPSPIPATEDNLIAGGKIYLNECAGCHGAPGKPNEPDALNPAAPRLAQVGTAYSEAQIFWVAKHGIRRTGMFANGVWDSDQKLWTVAAYIHRIKSLPPPVR